MKNINEINKIINSHKQDLIKNYNVDRIGIFGSYIRGEAKAGSDIDILVKLKSSISLLKLVGLKNYLTELLGIKADVIPENAIRTELRERILGEVLFI
jgi:uncharacterized protein